LIILADENLHRGIANRLTEAGHDVTHIASLSPSVTDDEVLAQAVETGALLITNDLDFGEMVFTRGAHHAGVLLLRLGAMPLPEQASLVERILCEQGEQLERSFSVLSGGRLRIRRREPAPG
jgi:predicted nuclease of predicted toxin-antitoxin system